MKKDWREERKFYGCIHPLGCTRCNWCGFRGPRPSKKIRRKLGRWIRQRNFRVNNRPLGTKLPAFTLGRKAK